MTATTTATNLEVCTRAQLELFGAGRLELADEMIAPDCVDHGAESRPGSPAPRGPDRIKGVVRWLRGAFPDLTYQVDDAFGDGDRVALRCTARGTSRGEFLGRPPTGRSFEVQQIHLFRLDGGRIAEHWACRDDVAMMQQLGLAS